jgi:cytochrome c5
MADPHAKMTKTTPQEVVVAVVGGLLAPLLAIFLVVQLILGIQAKHVDVETSEAANKATLARIAPVATLEALDANAPRVEKSGEEVFNAVCTSCHTAGALGAPKFKNSGDWAPRIKRGYDTLVKHALEGIRQMPARGGNPDLSDTEVARAVVYMANAAGAKFKEPAAATPPAPAAAAAPAGGSTAAPAAAAAGMTPAPAAESKPQAAPAKVADNGKGEAVYKANCAACHAAGVAGALKLGDKGAWAPCLARGMDALYAAGLKGKGAMPAKGGNPALADGDVKAAIDYMAAKAR